MTLRRLLAPLTLGLFWLIPETPVPGQYVPTVPNAVYYYPAPPRSYQSPPVVPARRRFSGTSPVLPYNRSPYTDDWSTGRHLPFPKPWMLPTRDPAARGR